MRNAHAGRTGATYGVGDITHTPDRTVPITLEQARQLPNMLGRIAPAMLVAHGRYTATVDGLKTLYVLRQE